ncbi:glycosyltransferase, partial [Patescibacteria group bacterium]|nr:glycosyltransferase [Patescibacteria group bacterium]
MKKLPKVSFVIPARQADLAKPALRAIKKLDYPQDRVEVLLAEGTNPSRQRNLAVGQARGELVYFLDNDSQPDRQSLRRAVAVFQGERTAYRHPRGRGFSLLPGFLSRFLGKLFFSGQIYRGEVGVVGGPSVWFGKETFWQGVSGSVFESFFAYFKMVPRFRPVGEPRRSTEKEMVLC